jgi:hypothetical protein
MAKTNSPSSIFNISRDERSLHSQTEAGHSQREQDDDLGRYSNCKNRQGLRYLPCPFPFRPSSRTCGWRIDTEAVKRLDSRNALR